MPNNNRNNQSTQMAADQGLIDGFTKHAATLTSLLVAGSTIKTTDLIVTLQARIAAIKLALTAKAAFMAAVAAARADVAKSAALVSGARQALKTAFAGQVDTLADFGLKPPKVRTPLTAEQKLAAAAKAKATRAARHTMGSKQKAKVTGATAAAASSGAAVPAASGGSQPVTPVPAATQGPGVTPPAPPAVVGSPSKS